MAYVYQISFDIPYQQFDEMRIGESVQTALAYMKALLPNEPGYISSRAMYSLSHGDYTHIYFQSIWEDWDSLLQHRSESRLNEGDLINEFQIKVKMSNLETHVFEEIG